MDQALKALLLPSEMPPRRSTIKRHLLFFDTVMLVDPSDAALVNMGDVSETFRGGMRVDWATRVPFPRVAEYQEALSSIKSETERLQQQGKIRFLAPTVPAGRLDAGLNWTTYSAAITDQRLVRAAVPDRAEHAPPFVIGNGVYTGATVSAHGEVSKYHVDVGPAAEVGESVDDRWNPVAWARIGRTLKYIRRSTVENAYPVSLDEPTQSILLTLSTNAFRSPPSVGQIADLTIATEVIDGQELEKALVDVPWAEVLKLRRIILPHAAKLRQLLMRNIRLAGNPASRDASVYKQELGRLQVQYWDAKNALENEWKKLRIVGASKALGTGAIVAGAMSALVLPTTLSEWLLALIAAPMTIAATAAYESASYIVAKDKLRAHPLFFFDGPLLDAARNCHSNRGDNSASSM